MPARRRAAGVACLAAGLAIACSPATTAFWTHSDTGREPPTKAPPLAMPETTQLHQVAIDAPDGTHVLVGRLRFPSSETYRLEGQSPMGPRLFDVGWDGFEWQIDVAAPLRGRLPASRIARDIGYIYLRSPPGDTSVVDERDRTNGTLLIRRVTEAGGRVIEITYAEYGWWGPAWLPRRVTLRSPKVRIDIVLVGLEPH